MRPTKFEDEYCDMLIEHMSKGLSFESFAGVVDVCKQTLYNWKNDHPEFLDAVNRGTEKSRLFWERLGIAGAAGKREGFNATSYIFNMKNRFPNEWRDRHEFIGGSTATPETALIAQLSRLTPEQIKNRHHELLEADKNYERAREKLVIDLDDDEVDDA